MIVQGDNRETLKTLTDNSIDAIVTDPPYGIDFLGKAWDANTGALETYQECLRVLKPGGYILAFSAARTYHHLAVTLERAGFEIRDQIMWLYSSGFPKAQDIGKAIDKRGVDNEYHGWKTALKPAHEPIAMARKPFKGSTIDNVQAHGVGALNIDATRIETDEIINANAGSPDTYVKFNSENNVDGPGTGNKINPDQPKWQQNKQGRFPSNVIGEVEDYQKFFYCPKVSRKERHIGFDTSKIPTDSSGYQGSSNGGNYIEKKQQLSGVGNNHPTVKPVELMKYLIKLVTPPNSIVLDPFCGSGSTGMAAVELGHEFIGCELDPAYVEIAEARIAAWNTDGTTKKEFFK